MKPLHYLDLEVRIEAILADDWEDLVHHAVLLRVPGQGGVSRQPGRAATRARAGWGRITRTQLVWPHQKYQNRIFAAVLLMKSRRKGSARFD